MTADKSINASERLETPIVGVFMDALECRFTELYGIAPAHVGFQLKNAVTSGINPTHSLETGVE